VSAVEGESRDDERRAAAHVIEALTEESRVAAAAAAEAARVASEEADGLRIGMASRLVIGQAQGILMERLDLDAEQAFAYLARASQANNVKLRDVAEELVRTRELPLPRA